MRVGAVVGLVVPVLSAMALLTSPSIHDYSDDTKLAILLALLLFSSLLVSAIVCACCVGGKRKKKNDQKLRQEISIVEKRKSTKNEEQSAKERKSMSEREDPTMKTIMQISPDQSFLRLPSSRRGLSSPLTVIIPKKKFATKTDRSKALPAVKLSLIQPIQPVRANDPAYRTLGDVEDPFGASSCASITLVAEKKETSTKKSVKEKKNRTKYSSSLALALLASKKSDRSNRSVTCRR